VKTYRTLVAVLVALAIVGGTAIAAAGAPGGVATGSQKSFTVAFSLPTGANPFLKATSDALRAYVKRAGGDYKTTDAHLNADQQVADIDQLVAQRVDAIALVAFDAQSVGPALRRAQDAGIKVFGVVFEINYNGDPPAAPVDGQVLDDRPQVAKDQAEYVNKTLNGNGQVAYIDFAAPVPALQFSQQAFADDLQKFQGLNLVGTFKNPSDDTAGGRTQAEDALTRYPDLNAIVAYNDTTALGAASAVSAAGKSGKVSLVGAQLEPAGATAIKRGKLGASADNQPVVMGKELGKLVVAAVRGKPKAQWRKTVIVPAKFYDKSNIGEWVPWAKQIAAISKKT
jgi:ribose transport system substrate-binding protein